MLRNDIIHDNTSGFSTLLNEVLSLNAQELGERVGDAVGLDSSMKS